jgi:hypothetical protein
MYPIPPPVSAPIPAPIAAPFPPPMAYPTPAPMAAPAPVPIAVFLFSLIVAQPVARKTQDVNTRIFFTLNPPSYKKLIFCDYIKQKFLKPIIITFLNVKTYMKVKTEIMII